MVVCNVCSVWRGTSVLDVSQTVYINTIDVLFGPLSSSWNYWLFGKGTGNSQDLEFYETSRE